jgi:hypothetical protein
VWRLVAVPDAHLRVICVGHSEARLDAFPGGRNASAPRRSRSVTRRGRFAGLASSVRGAFGLGEATPDALRVGCCERDGEAVEPDGTLRAYCARCVDVSLV